MAIKQNPIFLSFVLVSSIVFSSFSVCAEEKKPKGPPKRLTPVVAAIVSERMLAPTIKVPGTIISRQQAELPAEVDGRLISVAEVGTVFKSGQTVASLDDTLYRLKASENKASVTQKQTQLKFLEKELARLEELEKSDFSSKTELDRTRLDRDLARSELTVAQARVKLDEETLSRYTVKAPFDGVVIDRLKRGGEWINGGETVLTLSNSTRLEVEARVNEKTIRFIKVGSDVKVQKGSESSTAKVRAIVEVGDEKSHLFEIRVDLKGLNWLAGETVTVEVPTGDTRAVVAAPRDALLLRRSGVSVFKINADNVTEKIAVTTGVASGEFIEIIGEIKPGDNVVTRGSERLRPGQEVKIIPGAK